MRIFETRDAMIAELVKKGSVGCEIGVFAGEFAQTLVSLLNPVFLLLVDPWDLLAPRMFSGDKDGNNGMEMDTEFLFSSVTEKFKGNSAVRIVKDWSQRVLPALPDGSLDWIYIDGDHSYDGCYRDLLLAEPKVKAGGLIMCHDYEMNMKKCPIPYEFGVGRAVRQFCEERGWSLVAKGLDGCVSVALQKSVPEAAQTVQAVQAVQVVPLT